MVMVSTKASRVTLKTFEIYMDNNGVIQRVVEMKTDGLHRSTYERTPAAGGLLLENEQIEAALRAIYRLDPDSFKLLKKKANHDYDEIFRIVLKSIYDEYVSMEC